VYESDRLFAELDGLEWLQRQIERYSWKQIGRSSNLVYLAATVVYVVKS
jgi:hypothetical protein